MAKNYCSIEELIDDSIRCYDGMEVFWPQFNQQETMHIDIATLTGRSSANNGTIAFVHEGNLYVTPATSSAVALLGYENRFMVPFSNGEYPVAEKDRWFALREQQRQLEKEEFASDCEKYSEDHHIGHLSDETLAQCFEMPASGVDVIHPYWETIYFPVLNGHCFDCTVPDRLGTYDHNNGRVVFVYRDGRTFVAKDYKILDKLGAAGYRKASLFVPFSNGERIKDYNLSSRWESLK